MFTVFLFAPYHIIKIPYVEKGVFRLARRRGFMSDQFKEELAKDLGFYDVVQREGWGGIRARDAGNMVKRAVELAQQQLLNKRQ